MGDLNPYDSRVKCGNNSLCYDQIDYLNDYFNLQSVQEALGVEKVTQCVPLMLVLDLYRTL